MGHRMVLGYGDGLTILLWTTSNDRQVENLSYDVATNFQFVEHRSVSRRCPKNPTRPSVAVERV